MKKRWLALALALLTLVSAAALAEIAVPQPDSDLFYVYDGANVLSLETEAQIYYNNVNLYNACGAELVFVVVDDTNGYDLGAYSEAIFDAWELYDRDVLTVLSIDEENYWMLQGSSIERELTGSRMRALLDEYKRLQFRMQAKLASGENMPEEDLQRLQQIGTLLQFNPDVSAYLLAEFRFQKMLSDIFKILADVADIDLDSLTRS